jgi:hypothetical protein
MQGAAFVTIINFFFKEQAMFTFEQLLQESMLMLNQFWFEAAR